MSDSHDENASDPMPITFERVLEVLQCGEVDLEHGTIRWSSNYTFLTNVCFEDITLLAVYKPQRGERPLWDFPDGTLCMRERASFLTSEALGWKVVPPTVLREGPRGLGSFQFFVDHDPEHNYFAFDETELPQLMRLALFDTLVNNADRKGGHCLVDAAGHVWGIDHGLTFNSVHKLRTVIWNFAGDTVPDNLMEDVNKLCEQVNSPDDVYRQQINDLLQPGEMDAFAGRIRRILKNRKFPVPGPGPNYPWPPV